VFGNVGRKKKSFWKSCVFFISLKKRGALDIEGKMKKAEVVCKLERSMLMEEESWRQKSRDLWFKGG
jgi:hypothetical protein